MGLRIALISRDNGVGLSLDVDLLRELFTSVGHEVAFYDWRAKSMPRADVAFHLELVSRNLAQNAARNVAIPNLEWYPTEWLKYFPAFDQIWAKSRYTYDFCRARGAKEVHLTGFLGRDRLDETVPRRATCIHVRGKSSMKGTDKVVAAWQENPDLPPLTIVSRDPVVAPDFVTVVDSPDEAELTRLMNEAQIHLCPSIAEGWGHYITEAMSVGATVITTDASPMNEHIRPEWGYLLGVRSTARHHQAEQTFTTASFVTQAVRRAQALTPSQRRTVGTRARRHFLARNDTFRDLALKLVEK